jgi:hypothetical protein
MAFSFKNGAHLVATFVKAAVKDLGIFVEKAPAVINKIEETKPVVDKTLAGAAALGAPGAAVAANIADAAYAVAGELGQVLLAGTAAQQQHLADAGLNTDVLAEFKAFLAGITGLGTVVKSAVSGK